MIYEKLTTNVAILGSNPADFVAAFPDGAIIDEAQKVPEIFDALKMHVDASDYAPGKFILTGSSQFRLKSNMTDSMAGRVAFLKLLPFSVKELKDANALPDNPYDLIFGGQYPPLHDPEKHFLSEDWYESYIDTCLDLDVKGHTALALISNQTQLIDPYLGILGAHGVVTYTNHYGAYVAY